MVQHPFVVIRSVSIVPLAATERQVMNMRQCPSLIATLAFVIAFATASVSTAPAQTVDDQKTLSAEDMRADFKALYAGLQSGHYDVYVHRPKAEYDALYKRMLTQMDKAQPVWQASVTFQTFAAFGNVAHARLEFPEAAYQRFREGGGRIFPLSLRIVDGHAYVRENYSGIVEIKPGDEIVAIDDKPMSYWLVATASHISADTPYIAHSLLEFNFAKQLWLERGEATRFRLTLKGAQKVITVPAVTRAQMVAAEPGLPKVFDLNTPLREARMIEGGIAYLKPGPFYNAEDEANLWDNRAFVAFVDNAMASFIDAKAKVLVLDLRQNPGGDNSFSDDVVSWIAERPFRFTSAFRVKSSPEAQASNQARLDKMPAGAGGVSADFARSYAATPYGKMFDFDIPYAQPRTGQRFSGKVYVLINRHSYSNAVSVAAMVQDYKLGTIIGEKTTDMATTYGAMETFALPHSGLSVGFPKAHIIRPSGDMKSDGVTPDIAIETPIVATGEDEVLKRVLAVIKAAN
jgi:C-terminal processing protease CtpA/Prc